MNPALVITLKAIAYTLAVLLASPLLEGIMRKVKAIVHSRKGPPIRQPYLDLVKLLVKEDLVSESDVFARYAPPLAFASALAAAFFVPFGVAGPAQGMGDLFPFIYLITLSSTCIMIGGLAHGSPFSHLGSSREMMMVLTVEAAVIISLLIVGIGGHTLLLSGMTSAPFRISSILALFVYFFGMQALLGKLPFDIPEADQEIMEGPFIEYSGPSLALFKWTFHMRQLIFGSLFVNVFIGLPHLSDMGWIGSAVNFGISFMAVIIVSLLVALVDATNPRLKIGQSMRFFGWLIGVALIGVGLSVFGY
jgi:formate hydrogenlyase subunit 4